jgi:hypothetical protein
LVLKKTVKPHSNQKREKNFLNFEGERRKIPMGKNRQADNRCLDFEKNNMQQNDI